MTEHDDTEIARLLDGAASSYRAAPDLRDRVERRAARQQRRAHITLSAAVVLVVVFAAASLTWRSRQGVGLDAGSPPPTTTAPSTTTGTAGGGGSTGTSVASSVPPLPVAVPANAIDWVTPTVKLHAEDFRIEAAGKTFLAQSQLGRLTSDPGIPNEYTTLERVWNEHGVEMRLNIYFTSDGADWWANELRVYDGAPRGQWVTFTGELFRRPLGQPFTGDLDLADPNTSGARDARLTMRGVRIEAFVTPDACATQSTPFTLEVLYPTIEMTTAPNSGYGVDVRLRDAACQPVPDLTPYVFVYSVKDPWMITLSPGCGPDVVPACASRAQLTATQVGETEVRVQVFRVDGEEPIAEGSMRVVVTAG